jgi:hypothetical protein
MALFSSREMQQTTMNVGHWNDCNGTNGGVVQIAKKDLSRSNFRGIAQMAVLDDEHISMLGSDCSGRIGNFIPISCGTVSC